MERIKNFFVWGGLALLLAFVAYTLIGGLVYLCYPQFTMATVLEGAIGCGIGTGLVNGVVAAFRL